MACSDLRIPPDRKERSHDLAASNVAMSTHVLLAGPSYRGLDFDQREEVRENLRIRLKEQGIRFVEYCWVWDEQDRCLLLVGTYENLNQATSWMEALQSMGFELCTRTHLPGETAEDDRKHGH